MAMSPCNMLAVLMLIGVTYSAVIPEKERTRNEVWAEDFNLVEPPPAVMLFSRIFDNAKSKITPQNRLKSVIKAIYQYDTMKHNVRTVDENKDGGDSESVFDVMTEDKSAAALPEEERTFVEEDKRQEENVEEFLNGESNGKEEQRLGEYVSLEPKEQMQNSEELSSVIVGSTQLDVEPTPQTEQTTQKLEVLLEDLVDSIIHVPAHVEGDKAQKFTHSIRYGYGVPFHYNGL